MIEPNPALTLPSDEERLWRYIDFTKFVSMLETSTLFFARADSFDDKYEGRYSRADLEQLSAALAEHAETTRQAVVRTRTQATEALRKDFFINCWHRNSH